MKTTTTITPLPEINQFAIANHAEYSLVTVTASEGEDSASVSFPWHYSVQWGDERVKSARQQALDMAERSLLQFLQRKPKITTNSPKTPVERFFAFVAREFKYLREMASSK